MSRSGRAPSSCDLKSAPAQPLDERPDDYNLVNELTNLKAVFFAALASKLKGVRYQNAALVVALLVFGGTLIYVLSLPIEI